MPTNPALTEDGRRDLLKSLGLSADAPGLAPVIDAATTAKTSKVARVEAKIKATSTVADLDPRRIPASEIIFDPEMLADFTDLSGPGMAAASRFLFEHYKSPTKDRERNGLLHRRIGEFIQQVRRDRQQLNEPTGIVKEKVKQTKAQRDLAALIAERGITAEDLSRLIQERSASMKEEA